MHLMFENYFWIIYIAAFFTSIVSAAMGFVGGTMLLAIMAQFFKLELLIPLHGIIQLSSNGVRAWFLRKYINWQIGREAIIGSILGAAVGCFYMVPISENWSSIIIGAFILIVTLTPKSPIHFNIPKKWMIVGFIGCSVGLLIGAVGTFIGSLLLSENLEKREMVSTQAILQSVIHMAKVFVFSLLGFVLSEWVLLIAGAVICAYAGTFVGTKVLDLIPQKLFHNIMTSVVLILSSKLLYTGVMGL